MPETVFISYRSLDSAKVDTIANRLRGLKDSHGNPLYRIWQDKNRDGDGVIGAADWWESIIDAIIECRVFIFMISQESIKNANCLAELSYAYKRNRHIIPFVLSGEYFYDNQKGKPDITYMDQIPQELATHRRQLLFDDGTKSFQELETILLKCLNDPIPDFSNEPRPPDPSIVNDSTNNFALLYSEACDYAGRLELDKAYEKFRRLISSKGHDYIDESMQWREIITEYKKIMEADKSQHTQHKIPSLWQAYQSNFSNRPFIPFNDGLFDPHNFKSRFDKKKMEYSQVSPNNPISTNAQSNKPILPQQKQQIVSRQKYSSLDIMPAPFEWITIPAGMVTIVSTGGGYIKKDEKKELALPEYQISKYPITNRQFFKFINDGGYKTERWWTKLGWDAIQKRNITSEMWQTWLDYQGKTDKHLEHPVTNISWYEAVAFCLYLSDLTNENIMLPTEAQWQRAAQGNHDRKYPWGDSWDMERCNNRDTKKDGELAVGYNVKNTCHTTNVKKYEDKGTSEFHVVDMIGNVWEWCITDYDTGENTVERLYHGNYVLKGGSYESNKDWARAVFRHHNEGGNASPSKGFRIVRNL